MALRAFRAAKARYSVFDGEGARLAGGRWNSPGRSVIYASSCLAGALLEIAVHLGRVGLPGPHHAAMAEIPDDVAREIVDPGAIIGWDLMPDSPSARAFGDQWLHESRTAVLVVPAATARPLQQHILFNPAHPEYRRIVIQPPAPVGWGVRLFMV